MKIKAVLQIPDVARIFIFTPSNEYIAHLKV